MSSNKPKFLVIDDIKLLEYKHSSTKKYTLSILTEVYLKQNNIKYIKVEDYNEISHLIKYDFKNPITLMYLKNVNDKLKVIYIAPTQEI